MKIRSGFVSNSSSSSFVINKKFVSSHQSDLIYNHLEEVRRREKEGTYSEHIHCYDEWSISETDDSISGSCSMDNFDMNYYLTTIVGIDPSNIDWPY